MKLLNHFLILNMIPLVHESTSGIIVNNNSGAEKAFIILSVPRDSKNFMEVIQLWSFMLKILLEFCFIS